MRALTALTLTLLTGCSDPNGIYLLWFETDDTTSCDETITENFKDGEVPDSEDDSEWTYDTTIRYPDSLAFAQIVTTTSGNAVLIIDDAAYPGVRDAGVWTFEWDEVSVVESREEHEDGYVFTEELRSESAMTIVWPGPGESEGTASMDSTDEESWTESDEWGDAASYTIGTSGQIPSYSYLYEDTEYGWQAVYNGWEDDDCESDTCQLAVTTSCSSDSTFLVFETTYGNEDTYAHLEDAGQ